MIQQGLGMVVSLLSVPFIPCFPPPFLFLLSFSRDVSKFQVSSVSALDGSIFGLVSDFVQGSSLSQRRFSWLAEFITSVFPFLHLFLSFPKTVTAQEEAQMLLFLSIPFHLPESKARESELLLSFSLLSLSLRIIFLFFFSLSLKISNRKQKIIISYRNIRIHPFIHSFDPHSIQPSV